MNRSKKFLKKIPLVSVCALTIALAGCATDQNSKATRTLKGGGLGATTAATATLVTGGGFGLVAAGALAGAALANHEGTHSSTAQDKPVVAASEHQAEAEQAKPADQKQQPATRIQSAVQAKEVAHVMFAVGKYKLTAKDEAMIADVAKQIKQNDLSKDSKVIVLGYTDNLGEPHFNNKKLSQQRAKAVKQALVKAGLSASSIKAVGNGVYPLGNDSATGREKNRHAQILVLEKQATQNLEKQQDKMFHDIH